MGLSSEKLQYGGSSERVFRRTRTTVDFHGETEGRPQKFEGVGNTTDRTKVNLFFSIKYFNM